VLIPQVLGDGNIRVIFVQKLGINDNTYGANAIGWPKGHKFTDLTHNDHAVFEFRDGTGKVVMNFGLDYLSAITPTAEHPAGYRSLGATGGDGFITKGNASSILSWSTSLEENLNKQPFLGHLAQYTVDSPALADPNSAQWEYRMIYTVVVDQAAFGAAGFGSVMTTKLHNSPAKKTVTQPEPCSGCISGCITNLATGTAIAGAVTLTATDSAVVCPDDKPPSKDCPELPKFWKLNLDAWPAGYAPNQTVGSIFAKASLYPQTAGKTLLKALEGKGSSHLEVSALLQQAVAGLLNAASPNISYAYSESDIVEGVNLVLMSGNKYNIKALTALLKKANEDCKDGKDDDGKGHDDDDGDGHDDDDGDGKGHDDDDDDGKNGGYHDDGKYGRW
jgi:hypothetical protein